MREERSIFCVKFITVSNEKPDTLEMGETRLPSMPPSKQPRCFAQRDAGGRFRAQHYPWRGTHQHFLTLTGCVTTRWQVRFSRTGNNPAAFNHLIAHSGIQGCQRGCDGTGSGEHNGFLIRSSTRRRCAEGQLPHRIRRCISPAKPSDPPTASCSLLLRGLSRFARDNMRPGVIANFVAAISGS